jgi:hypothetical protein
LTKSSLVRSKAKQSPIIKIILVVMSRKVKVKVKKKALNFQFAKKVKQKNAYLKKELTKSVPRNLAKFLIGIKGLIVLDVNYMLQGMVVYLLYFSLLLASSTITN